MKGFEYNRLNATEKKYYDEMYNQLRRFRTELNIAGAAYEYICRIYSLILQDSPELFWLSGGSHGSSIGEGWNTRLTFRVNTRDDVSMSRVPLMSATLDGYAEALARKARRENSTLERVLYVHDYLAASTTYDLQADNCRSAYGCLVGHRAVCAGYARAFQLVMQKLGIPCGRVSGKTIGKRFSKTGHEWNYVCIDGRYYFIDVTWDSPESSNRNGHKTGTHEYFCLPSGEMRLTHHPKSEFFVPHCRSNACDYYVVFNLFAKHYSFDKVRDIAQRQIGRTNGFTVKFASRHETNRAVQELIKGNLVYRIPGIRNRISYSTSQSGLILTVQNA